MERIVSYGIIMGVTTNYGIKREAEVLDLDHADFNENTFGRVLLHPKHGGENQQWKIVGTAIICQYKDGRSVPTECSPPFLHFYRGLALAGQRSSRR